MTYGYWLRYLFFIILCWTFSSGIVLASPAEHIVIAPKCLVERTNESPMILASFKDMLLLKVDNDYVDKLSNAKGNYKSTCGGFINVDEEWQEKLSTDKPQPFLIKHLNTIEQAQSFAGPYSIKYPVQVKLLMSQINPSNMWSNLTILTQFYDRFSRNNNGVKAAKWIRTQIESIVANTGHTADVIVYEVPTGSYKQPSVVAKFGNSNGPAVVIGGHMDTVNPRNSPRPGADDDGTGTVTVLEVARTMLASKMKFKNPIYFIWYAAEEEGLIGSGYVVKQFKQNNIQVNGVMQFDMTGYTPRNSRTMVLYTDNTTSALNTFITQLIKTYLGRNVTNWRCGYGCSDHVSWFRAGYPASFPFEIGDNPNIHTSRDTMSLLSLSYMTDFAKLGTAFATELAEPIS